MTDPAPYSFTLDRGDSESMQLLYSREQDRFWQLQMSHSENSCFLDRAVIQEVRVYLVTPYNGLFVMLPLLLKAFQARQGVFQSLAQILEQLPSEDVRLILSQSEHVKHSLPKVCDSKLVVVGETQEMYYSFDLARNLFPYLQSKYCEVKRHLA